MTRATVTPLEALKRLIEACKLVDFKDCPDLYNQFQTELAVAEMVVRDFPTNDILIANKLRDAAADPMWDGHAEVSKRLLVLAAENMEVARARIVELEGHGTAQTAVATALEGYTLVPNSPNEEMLRPDGFSYRLGYDQYQAMLRAAPVGAQPDVVAAPIAWLRNDGSEAKTAQSKAWMETRDYGYWNEVAKLYTIPLYAAPAIAAPVEVERDALKADDVQWIVNDNAELGVKIGDQFFFLYKGRSLVYESGTHDDGRAMMYRPVFKREFGECAHPINHNDYSKIGTVSISDSDEWKPIDAAIATGDKHE